MKMFYNMLSILLFFVQSERGSSIVQNIEWVQFVLQNCEKLHSVQGLQCMIKKKRLVVLFTSDVMYNWKVQKAALHATSW